MQRVFKLHHLESNRTAYVVGELASDAIDLYNQRVNPVRSSFGSERLDLDEGFAIIEQTKNEYIDMFMKHHNSLDPEGYSPYDLEMMSISLKMDLLQLPLDIDELI
jgi:hypothetical protein